MAGPTNIIPGAGAALYAVDANDTRAMAARKRKLAEALGADAISGKYGQAGWASVASALAKGLTAGYMSNQADKTDSAINKRMAQALDSGDLNVMKREGLATGTLEPEDILKSEMANRERSLGMQPYYWTTKGPDGKDILHAGQLLPGGGVKEIDAGTPSPPVSFQDTGPTISPRSTRTGEEVGPAIPKDAATPAAQKTIGEASGDATVNLPTMETNAARFNEALDNLQTNKEGYGYAAGNAFKAGLPALFGKQADFVNQFNTVMAKEFQQGYQEFLKGTGQIATAEGKAGQQAMSALSRVGTRDEFDKQIGIIRRSIAAGIANTQTKAAMVPGSGNVSRETPPAGNKNFTYDAQGNLIQQ